MRPLSASLRARSVAVGTLFAAAAGLVIACSSSPSNDTLGSGAPGGGGTGSSGGSGATSSSGSGSGAGGSSGSGGGTSSGGDGGEAGGSQCTAADLVAQQQCGAGMACDVERHAMTFTPPGSSGGGGGDGGGGGGGDGGGGGGSGAGGSSGSSSSGAGLVDAGGGGGEAGGDSGGGTGVGNETLVCRKTTTNGTEGAPCTASDPTTCAAGYSCGEPGDGSTDAVCYKFCNTDTDCTAPGGWCHPGPLQTAAAEGFTAKTCSLNCDPIAQKGCGTGENCDLAITDDRSRLYTQCIAAGTGGYQAACTAAEDCQAGFSCLHVVVNGGSSQQMCLQACIPGATTTGACPSGQACQAIPPPDTLGTTAYGWCY